MRIIGGALKRRKLFFPRSKLTRPVTDRAKETMFNVLGGTLEPIQVLDLFAGSGSLGIEALSRGAKTVFFVDIQTFAIDCIRKNLTTLGLNSFSFLFRKTCENAIEMLAKQNKKFDLIFSDPPHNKGLIKKTLHALDRSDILAPLGIIVVGHSNKEPLPEELKSLQLKRSIKMGQGFVSFLMRKSDLCG
ncbi:MAG: 16S rRNA (guanine(966)-N(2))-methyltransferase RsmD [Omnitrophica bacterium RIFCSPHIGHO2_02_FULL_49_9]|nr:MAG: 16S rRNA (guanine(966)-N(2))-methyltransferase RsmD [Omnitrophica bacterium RIFCSPHIGHO2_02_FULL_49_9]OGW89842.1 MAG: 16S rRNA (guanine(966)-N(2))-methyltransferase RsmD [Omnitrophica bacterium RIFCSPLOWO2_01_FULL_50_24]